MCKSAHAANITTYKSHKLIPQITNSDVLIQYNSVLEHLNCLMHNVHMHSKDGRDMFPFVGACQNNYSCD